MRAYNVIGLVVIVFLLTGPVSTTAHTINDYGTQWNNSYWGGVVNGGNPSSTDVYGYPSYDVEGIDVTVSGNSMTVKLVGTFFSPGGAWSRYNLGDLYISSTGWQVSSVNSPNFSDDRFTNTEGWKYVVTGGNSPGVYLLDFNSITMTDPTYTGNGGRAYQAWQGGYGTFIEGATIDFPDSTHPYMSFTFDDSFLGNPLNVGLHWTMYCGNDVIEGQVTLVPEPGTFLLLGGGLIALGALRRKFKK